MKEIILLIGFNIWVIGLWIVWYLKEIAKKLKNN
jgi:hypothetical protein